MLNTSMSFVYLQAAVKSETKQHQETCELSGSQIKGKQKGFQECGRHSPWI